METVIKQEPQEPDGSLVDSLHGQYAIKQELICQTEQDIANEDYVGNCNPLDLATASGRFCKVEFVEDLEQVFISSATIKEEPVWASGHGNVELSVKDPLEDSEHKLLCSDHNYSQLLPAESPPSSQNESFPPPSESVQHDHVNEIIQDARNIVKDPVQEMPGEVTPPAADVTGQKTHVVGGATCQCMVCKKPYPRMARLMRRSRSHIREKRFQCTVCNMLFTHMSNLAYHSRAHTGETPYQCKVCKRRFPQSRGLTSHKCRTVVSL